MTEPASRPIAPPSRWLLLLTAAVAIVFTAWRLWLAATLDFRSDEAYYWTWSHQCVLSYLDHPPMVAWFERLGQLIFGDTPLGARVGQLLALPVIQLLLGDIARRRTGSWNAALFVVLALEGTVNYAVVVSIVEPSVPLLLFASLLLWALSRLDETADGRWWLLIGVAGGLALLSKYIALLLVPALLLFVLSKQHRRWLSTRWPYLAGVTAVLIFSPVVIWNVRHGLASFAFQSTRLGGGQPLQSWTLERFVLFETLFVGPVLAPASIVGAVALGLRGLRRHEPFNAAVATAFLFPALFFLVRSLTLQINQSWAYFMWPIGILALALVLPWRLKQTAVLVGAVAATGLPVAAALLFHGTADTKVWMGRGDPFGQDAGYRDMAQRVLADARAEGASWIATSEYRTYALLQWQIGRDIPVVQVNERARFLDFAAAPDVRGKALYVHTGRAAPLIRDDKRQSLEKVPVLWRGVKMSEITVETVTGFTPDLKARADSPAYPARP